MNLKQLVQTQEELRAQRGHEAEAQCRQAYHLLAEAEAAGFADKTPLKQAMQLFSQALRQYPGFLEPYLGLAYLSILLEQTDLGRRYLEMALQLEPDHEEALHLLRFIDEDTHLPKVEASINAESDRLYDHLEQQLFYFFRTSLRFQWPPADEELTSQAALQAAQAHLHERIQAFETELERLEPEFDTTALRRHLGPAERALQGIAQAQALALEMAACLPEIQIVATALRDLHAQVAQHLPWDEGALETVTDRYDWLVDQVGAFEAQGGACSGLKRRLNVLQALLEQLQENIDARRADS